MAKYGNGGSFPITHKVVALTSCKLPLEKGSLGYVINPQHIVQVVVSVIMSVILQCSAIDRFYL